MTLFKDRIKYSTANRGHYKSVKQIYKMNITFVKNPKSWEANQLGITKHGLGFEKWATGKQNQMVRWGLESETAVLQVRRPKN